MNQTPVQAPSFERFTHLLDAVELDVGASEIHGVIAGLLCAGHAEAHAIWFADLFENLPAEDVLVNEARQMLGELYRSTRDQVNDMGNIFTPYLPDDSLSLQERAKCLSEWCQGFLYGLGLAGIDQRSFSGDAEEAIQDLAEFTRLDYESIQPDEESEAAYMQLQEYLRVATSLIWEELSSIRTIADESE